MLCKTKVLSAVAYSHRANRMMKEFLKKTGGRVTFL